jgi:hypothetical protein
LYKKHVTILDDLMSEVLDMLGSLSSSNDVVSPFNAGSVVFKHLCALHLSEAQKLEDSMRRRFLC